MRRASCGQVIVLTYNFRGLRTQHAKACLSNLSREFGWHVILGQEVTKAQDFPELIDNHRVIADVATCGIRVTGILLGAEWTSFIEGSPHLCGTVVGLLGAHPLLGRLFLSVHI